MGADAPLDRRLLYQAAAYGLSHNPVDETAPSRRRQDGFLCDAGPFAADR